MRARYFLILGIIAAFAVSVNGLNAQTTVDKEPLSGDVGFPDECLLPGESGGFTFTDGQSVTVTTVKYNPSTTNLVLTILSYYDHATAVGFGSVHGVSAQNAPYRIVEASASLTLQLVNGYGENDQILYTNYIGQGSAPDISGYSIIHIAAIADPNNPDNPPQIISNVTKNKVNCPVTCN